MRSRCGDSPFFQNTHITGNKNKSTVTEHIWNSCLVTRQAWIQNTPYIAVNGDKTEAGRSSAPSFLTDPLQFSSSQKESQSGRNHEVVTRILKNGSAEHRAMGWETGILDFSLVLIGRIRLHTCRKKHCRVNTNAETTQSVSTLLFSGTYCGPTLLWI